MSELISAGMQQALRDRRPLILLAEIDHPAGMARVHTGIGTIRFDGEDWYGVGIFGSVGPVTVSTETVIQEVTLDLSGVEPVEENLQFLNANVRTREARVWLAALNEAGQIIREPFDLMQAQLDYQTQEADDESGEVTISIVARSGFYTLERALDEAWTSESQRRLYPDDTGLDLITSLQNKEILWTRT